MDSQYSSEWTSLTASLGRTLQAVGLFRVGDDLGVEAAGAGGVKDTDGFVVAAEQARAVAVECHTVGRRHLVHSVVGPVGCAQLAAYRIPQVQRVRLPNHALSAGDDLARCLTMAAYHGHGYGFGYGYGSLSTLLHAR